MIMDPPIQKDSIQQVLCKALEEISKEKQYQEKCLLLLIDVLQPYEDSTPEKRQNSVGTERFHKLSKYQSMVSLVLMATLPPHFSEILHWYFKGMLEELSTITADDCEDDNVSHDRDDMDLDEKSTLPYRTGDMDVDGCYRQKRLLQVVKNIGIVVCDLRKILDLHLWLKMHMLLLYSYF